MIINFIICDSWLLGVMTIIKSYGSLLNHHHHYQTPIETLIVSYVYLVVSLFENLYALKVCEDVIHPVLLVWGEDDDTEQEICEKDGPSMVQRGLDTIRGVPAGLKQLGTFVCRVFKPDSPLLDEDSQDAHSCEVPCQFRSLSLFLSDSMNIC